MPSLPLQVAEHALLDERRPLTRDEVARGRRTSRSTSCPSLIALAHQVRLAYCGPEVELESLINAKSGACPEDCAFCSQSVRFHTDVDVYPFLDLDEVLAAAHATRDAGATQFCIVVAVRGPEERLLRKVIDAVDAVHARDRPRSRVLARAAQPGAGRAPRGRGRAPLQPQPRSVPRGVPVDLHHAHLRRPRRDRAARDRRGHGAVLRRHPRHGRDARAARRLRVRARRARAVRGADQPARSAAGHAARRSSARSRRARRCRRSRCSGCPAERVAPARRRPRARARRAAGHGPARRRQRADRRQLPHDRSAAPPKKTTRCSRRSACRSPTGPGEGRFVVDADGAHDLPAKPARSIDPGHVRVECGALTVVGRCDVSLKPTQASR